MNTDGKTAEWWLPALGKTHHVQFGKVPATCMGNSPPLPPPLAPGHLSFLVNSTWPLGNSHVALILNYGPSDHSSPSFRNSTRASLRLWL